MRIQIAFDSCWQTGFLEDEKITVKDQFGKRKFLATSKAQKNGVAPNDAPISEHTVMGVLNRLIGEQRKLYQARKRQNYYFKEIEERGWVRHEIISAHEPIEETVYLINKSNKRCPQSTYLGVIDDNNPWFFSDHCARLWSVLYLSRQDLLAFICSETPCGNDKVNCDPLHLWGRIEALCDRKSEVGSMWKFRDEILSLQNIKITKKEKALALVTDKLTEIDPTSQKYKTAEEKQKQATENLLEERDKLKQLEQDQTLVEDDAILRKALAKLTTIYPDINYEESSGRGVFPINLYAGALYLQAERLLRAGVDIEYVKKGDGIQVVGFSKGGFNGVRDWLGKMTGNRPKAVGTACPIQKHSGILQIFLKIDEQKAIELKHRIENAGVSSFYLGKKGLAYVSDMDVRESLS